MRVYFCAAIMDKAGAGKFCQPHQIDMHICLIPDPFNMGRQHAGIGRIYHIGYQCQAQARHRVHTKRFQDRDMRMAAPHQYKVSLYRGGLLHQLASIWRNWPILPLKKLSASGDSVSGPLCSFTTSPT